MAEAAAVIQADSMSSGAALAATALPFTAVG